MSNDFTVKSLSTAQQAQRTESIENYEKATGLKWKATAKEISGGTASASSSSSSSNSGGGNSNPLGLITGVLNVATGGALGGIISGVSAITSLVSGKKS